jgi:RecA/RadA recombinase
LGIYEFVLFNFDNTFCTFCNNGIQGKITMAKQKKTNIENDVFDDIASLAGGELLADQAPVKYYIDTGNLAVNAICSGRFFGGGMPGGRIIELLGPAAGGKSLWGCNFVRGIQVIDGVPVYLDCENALNPQFAVRSSHINPDKVLRLSPADGIDCLERTFLKVHNIIRKVREKHGPSKPLGFVYDSISVSPSERELRETTIDENFTEAEWKRKVGAKEQPGERAKICNKEFRKLEAVLEKADTTMLVINQIRQKIGSYGNPEIGSTAATVLEYYSCLRLRVSAHKKIENKHGLVIGINLKVKNIKNRIHKPFMEADGVQLFFEKGVNPLSGLLILLEQMERIEKVGVATYKVKEPWSNGQDVTFKATKAANMIDADVLCKCPALVDAKDETQVLDYLSIFREAIEQTLSDDTHENPIGNDDVSEFQ